MAIPSGQPKKFSRRMRVYNGPSREDLFDALRLRAENRQVRFEIEGPTSEETIRVVINGLEAESGSGRTWLVKGYEPGEYEFKMYYEIDTRIGWIQYRDKYE